MPHSWSRSIFRLPRRWIGRRGGGGAGTWSRNIQSYCLGRRLQEARAEFLTHGVPSGQGYPLLHRGGGRGMPALPNPFLHTLDWPADAWWQWAIREKMLWAWHRRHAEQILAYVRATARPSRPTHGPLRIIPTHFLSAKVRDAVVKAMEKKLQAT